MVKVNFMVMRHWTCQKIFYMQLEAAWVQFIWALGTWWLRIVKRPCMAFYVNFRVAVYTPEVITALPSEVGQWPQALSWIRTDQLEKGWTVQSERTLKSELNSTRATTHWKAWEVTCAVFHGAHCPILMPTLDKGPAYCVADHRQ